MRTLGRTGPAVSDIGLGCMGIHGRASVNVTFIAPSASSSRSRRRAPTRGTISVAAGERYAAPIMATLDSEKGRA